MQNPPKKFGGDGKCVYLWRANATLKNYITKACEAMIYVKLPEGFAAEEQRLPFFLAMEEFLAVLTDRKGHPLTLKMKRCPVCGKIYLRGDKYQKFWCPLKNYSFIRTKTGRPPSESYIGAAQHSGSEAAPVDWDEVYPTPDYLVRALRHPYQGGRCSGK